MSMNFGIVGCGMISHFHAKAIEQIGGKVVACFDQVAESAAKLAEETNCQAYSDLQEFLSDKNVKIVTVCTPSGLHYESAIGAANHGKHVIVEKPLDVTVERCDEIISACEKAGVVLATIFPSRFHQSAQRLKAAIDAGRFGRLTLGDAIVKWYRTQAYYDSGDWRGTWKYDGGGALMNQAIHTIDLLTWLMGPVVEVSAQTELLAHENIEVEDCAVATVRFKNGALGIIEASTAAYPGYLKRIEISGSKGSAILEEEDLIKWDFDVSIPEDDAIHEQMKNRISGGGGAADPAAIGHHAHAKLFADVIEAIKTGRKPLVDGHEGRKSVEIICSIYESAKNRVPVKID